MKRIDRCHFIHYNGPEENKRCKNQSKYKFAGYMFGDKTGNEINACEEHYGDLVTYPQIFWKAKHEADNEINKDLDKPRISKGGINKMPMNKRPGPPVAQPKSR